MKNDLVYRTEKYITKTDEYGNRACARILVLAILGLLAAVGVSFAEGLLIEEETGHELLRATSVFDAGPVLSFASPDAKSYYMGADIGSAFRASDYRAKTGLGAVVKAPFVLCAQVVKGVVRIPGAVIENAKHDPGEAAVQGLAALLAVGSQTDWYGFDEDSKPSGTSGSFGIGPDGSVEGKFDNVTGSVMATVEKKEPTPEGTKETTVTIEIDQNDKD